MLKAVPVIDLHRLRILRAVAQHGSFSAAATALHLSPAAVSQHIAALERAVGTPVVDRGPRGVRLTAPGQVLVATAEAVAAELDGARQEVERLISGNTGRLAVATFASAGQRLLPDALSGFLADNPCADVSVIEAEPEVSMPLVRDGGADLALVYRFSQRDPDEPGLRLTLLMSEPMFAILPASHPRAGAARLTLAELADDRWFLGTNTTGSALAHQAALSGFTPNVVCRGDDYLFIHAMVGAGVGVALVPQLGLPDPPDPRVAVVPVAGPGPSRHVYAVAPRAKWTNPLADDLLARLGATAAGCRAVPGLDRKGPR